MNRLFSSAIPSNRRATPRLFWAACACLLGSQSVFTQPAVAQPESVVDSSLQTLLIGKSRRDVIEAYGYTADSRRPVSKGIENTNIFIGTVAKAVRRHPSVRSVVASRDEANETVKAERAPLFPQVDVGLDTRSRYTNRTADDRETEKRTVTGLNGFVTVSQLLFDAGSTFDRIDAAKERARAGKDRVNETAQEFALRAISAYLDVARYTTEVDLAQDNVKSHENIYGYLSERIDAGAGTSADVTRAEGRMAEARSDYATLVGSLERAKASYAELYKTEPSMVPLPLYQPELPPTADQAVASALRQNPELRQQRQETKASQFEYFAERANRYPKVAVEVSGTQFNVSSGVNTELYDVTARLSVNYSLYSGGAETARRNRARSRFRQARYDVDNLQLQVERAVRFAMTEVSSRRERLRAYELGAKADEQSIAAYAEQYTIGRRTLTELLDVQRDQFRSLVNLVDTRVDLEIARYQLLAMVGSLPEFLGLTELSLPEESE